MDISVNTALRDVVSAVDLDTLDVTSVKIGKTPHDTNADYTRTTSTGTSGKTYEDGDT